MNFPILKLYFRTICSIICSLVLTNFVMYTNFVHTLSKLETLIHTINKLQFITQNSQNHKSEYSLLYERFIIIL